MLQSSKINHYTVTKLLSSSDYLCFDEFQNLYLLVPTKSPQNQPHEKQLLHIPNIIFLIDTIEEEQMTFYCYQLTQELQWIGDINPFHFKSEVFCLTILYNILSKILKPIFDQGFNPYGWIHINNLWYSSKNSQIYLLPHGRQNSNKGVSQSLYNEKETLRKLSKMLTPLFRVNLQNNTFLSILMKSMINSELSTLQILEMLIDKKSRKKYIMKFQNNKNKSTTDNSLFVNDKKILAFKLRRNLRYENQQQHHLQLKKYISAKHSFDEGKINKSLQPKKQSLRAGMFHVDTILTSASKSRRKKSENYQKSRYSQKKYSMMTEKSEKINKISAHLMEKAKRKYQASIEFEQSQFQTLKIKDLQFRKKFQYKRSTTVPYQRQKSIISKTPKNDSQITQKRSQIKKKLFQTIDHPQTKIQWNKSSFQTQRRDEMKEQLKFLKIKEEELAERERKAKQYQEKIKMKTIELEEMKKKQEEKRVPKAKMSFNTGFYSKQYNLTIQNEDQKNIQNIPNIQLKEKNKFASQRTKNIEVVKQEQKANQLMNFEEDKKKKVKRNFSEIGNQKQTNDDEIEEIVLEDRERYGKIVQKKDKKVVNSEIQTKNKRKYEQQKFQNEQIQTKKRTKTNQSMKSSQGSKKHVTKIVDEYILMINKIGQAVAKTSRLDKKLDVVEWFTGIYFLYKRFFFERKKVLQWILKNQPKITRYGRIQKSQWEVWLGLEERQKTLKKVMAENQGIEKSIQKMHKRISKKNLQGNILYHAELSHHSAQEESKIAMRFITKEYDQLSQRELLKDPEIFVHMCECINALFIMGELDGKIKQRRSLMEVTRTKRSPQQLSQLVDEIYELYVQQKN